jgi:hypothetical protein
LKTQDHESRADVRSRCRCPDLAAGGASSGVKHQGGAISRNRVRVATVPMQRSCPFPLAWCRQPARPRDPHVAHQHPPTPDWTGALITYISLPRCVLLSVCNFCSRELPCDFFSVHFLGRYCLILSPIPSPAFFKGRSGRDQTFLAELQRNHCRTTQCSRALACILQPCARHLCSSAPAARPAHREQARIRPVATPLAIV